MIFQPESYLEVQEIIQSHQHLLLRSGGSKTALSSSVSDTPVLDLRSISGILAYDPEEFVFTARAGTPLLEISQALSEHHQYLPFDPILLRRGATLGGTVAANTAGSGRYRFGGVRDFVLGVRFIDGLGRLVQSGGKVVKNAAGFDLAKFMVGSLGRYGAMMEMSLKVFPQPQAYATIVLAYAGLQSALQAIFYLGKMPFELDALDLQPRDQIWQLLIRLGGLPGALPARCQRISAQLRQETQPAGHDLWVEDRDEAFWWHLNDLAWMEEDTTLTKIPLAPAQIMALDAKLEGMNRRYTAGANVAWLATADRTGLEAILNPLNLVGVHLLGAAGSPYCGVPPGQAMVQRVKRALDPQGVFLEA